jgi:hypothetical protein
MFYVERRRVKPLSCRAGRTPRLQRKDQFATS